LNGGSVAALDLIWLARRTAGSRRLFNEFLGAPKSGVSLEVPKLAQEVGLGVGAGIPTAVTVELAVRRLKPAKKCFDLRSNSDRSWSREH
jgi:hypothetical protein